MGKEISDLAVVPLADLFQRLHSTDAADPSYERMTSASESLFGETGRGFDPDEGPIGRVGAGDECVEVDAAHDPPVTSPRCMPLPSERHSRPTPLGRPKVQTPRRASEDISAVEIADSNSL